MANLVISEELAKRLQNIAQRENRTLDSMVEELLKNYENGHDEQALWEAVPEDIEDKAGYVEALKKLRPMLYEMAREYWRKVGDQQRLALTDRELDRQFWLIDHDGIPRLKSDQGKVQLPRDPMDDLIGLVDTDITDLSMRVRETMAARHRSKNDRTD